VSPRSIANPAIAGAAWTLLLDAVAVECISTLRAEEIQAILLKGPVTAQLYSGPDPRTYGDVDLLVAPDEFPRALRTLEGLGFRNLVKARDTLEGTHAVPLRLERPSVAGGTQFPAGLAVDLHWSFHGIGASDEVFWTIVAGDAERMLVSGTEVDVPSEAMRALLLALHATSAGTSFRKPLKDLDRALERLPDDTWRDAQSLAARLDSLTRFAAGLSTRPLGRKLVDRLQLSGTADARSALHTEGAPPPLADAFVRVSATRGVAPKVRLLARGLIPTPASMRLHWRLARRGRLGLALAYMYRTVWLLAKVPAALRAQARARRIARADDRGEPGFTKEQ
jgi:hypothetical protein